MKKVLPLALIAIGAAVALLWPKGKTEVNHTRLDVATNTAEDSLPPAIAEQANEVQLSVQASGPASNEVVIAAEVVTNNTLVLDFQDFKFGGVREQ